MDFRRMTGSSFILFDGAMGTMLQDAGLKNGELPEIYNMIHPEIVEDIHSQYIRAGAGILTANTFGANEIRLARTGYTVEEVIYRAVDIAKKAAGKKSVALDVGPTGELMEPYGKIKFDRAYDIFKRQVKAGDSAGADLILIETMGDLYEAKAAVLAAKENCTLPVFCTMTFQKNGRTLMGTDPASMVNVLEGIGVDALGINCSLGPGEIMPVVEEILKYASIPVIVQPNAGLPRVSEGRTFYDINPEEFASYIGEMARMGARIFGGCCGTRPEHIKAVHEVLKSVQPVEVQEKRITAASSSTKTVVVGNEIRVIGERINPSGREEIKAAFKNGDLSCILSEAVSQGRAGADMLDINIGIPEIDEPVMMKKVVEAIQPYIDIPLVIDSRRPDAIEAAVRVYNGKPVINSVDGDDRVMKDIFPIAAKYGACVIGLTMDEKGIPSTAEERADIAGKIISTARANGIPERNIIIDTLVLTAASRQGEVMEAIRAVNMVKERYKAATVLGISNISYGLPARAALNRTYLAMALAGGLDAAIVNPMGEGIMETIAAFKVLSNQDIHARNYIKTYGNADRVHDEQLKQTKDLTYMIMDGNREGAVSLLEEYLKKMQPREIIDKYIIPALNEVGRRYESGEIFLPQLMGSAEAAGDVFAVIKNSMDKKNSKASLRGKVLIATVKGDMHDLGKNIVKLILESYGFEVIDLGHNISPEVIVEKSREEDVKLIGLSAIMTTTVKSMEETIKLVHDSGLKCKVMVGGPVLNEEYARSIGADFYAADAMGAVKIAQSLFKESTNRVFTK